MFGAFGKALTASSLVFVSKAAAKSDLRKRLGVDKQFVAVRLPDPVLHPATWCVPGGGF
jgi:urease alpha subunit